MRRSKITMNKRMMQNYEELARKNRLVLDSECKVLYGQRGDYNVLVHALSESYPYQLTVFLSAQRAGGPVTKEEGKQFAKEHKPVLALRQDNHAITMTLRNIANQEKLSAALDEALNALISFLRTNGFQNCCQTCGSNAETDGYCVGTAHMLLCPDCYTSITQNTAIVSQQKSRKKENLLGGIVGALLGSLLGVACIIVISQLGYVAAISGVVMAICTLKGYELLGGKLTRKGTIISVVLMLLMTYIGDRLDWAISVMRELETDFATSYQIVPLLLQEEIIEAAPYWGNLLLVYFFVLLGAVPTVHNIIKNQGSESRLCRIGAARPEIQI